MDIEHFNNLQPPLSPNNEEVLIYEKYCKDTNTLLLGYTKELMHLCTEAMDINPPTNCDSKIIKQDWYTNTKYYSSIIGDGVLNLVSGELVSYLSKYCDTLVIRFFTEKIETMKYATHFRNNTPLLLPDIIIETQPKCKILIWRFTD
jgi:hypothetical protein